MSSPARLRSILMESSFDLIKMGKQSLFKYLEPVFSFRLIQLGINLKGTGSRLIGLALGVLALSACGFTPLYVGQGDGNMTRQLESIRVTPVTDVSPDIYRDDYYRQGRSSRLAMLFQDGLSRQMRGGGEAAYLLQVSLEQKIEGFGVRPDESFTRQRITLIARYELKSAIDGKLVYRGEAKSDGGVDRVRSEYATLVAERAAGERNASQLVREITAKLALALQGKLGGTGGVSQPQSPRVLLPSDGLGTAGTSAEVPR
jgi:LPS-assembly lipoprotein